MKEPAGESIWNVTFSPACAPVSASCTVPPAVTRFGVRVSRTAGFGGISSVWPIVSRSGLAIEFALTIASVVTPNRRAMPSNVSPDRTW